MGDRAGHPGRSPAPGHVPPHPPQAKRRAPHAHPTGHPRRSRLLADVLHQHGHLHRAKSTPDNTWTVQRTPHTRPWTLHHPVLAMDWIEELVLEIRQQNPETTR